MDKSPEFRWHFVVNGDDLELKAASQVSKDIRVGKIQENSKNIISFSELSYVNNATDAWNAALHYLYRLNKLIATFTFRPKDIEITGEVYESDGSGKAHQKASITFAIS